MQEYINIFLDMTGNIATSITLAITLVTAASLLLVNVARYFQAKKYGIPLKMVSQASLPDSLDLWVILISAFGFGRFLPGFITNLDINMFAALAIAFISCFASIMLLKGKAYFKHYHKAGNYSEIQIGLSEKANGIAAFSLIVACLFLYVGYVNRSMIVDYEFIGNSFFYVLYRAASILLIIYRILIGVLFAVCVLAKIYGDKDTMTVDIDGQPYLLATQHSQFQWVLVPCVFEKNKREDGGLDDIVKFIKGRFIIRDMSTLDGYCQIVCREGYALLGVAPQEEREDSENEKSTDNSL
ncbi:MAG: hypothetical protein FWC73_05635 [Defluviitaleaceae bacterium]|nr:hypothetical protein [Defluviitaleaceae bacterium]